MVIERDMSAAVGRRDVVAALRALGIERGAAVLVHSSLSSMGYVDGGAAGFVDGLVEAVGTQGLAVVPTHTWGTVRASSPVFHHRLHPSIVGRISEVFRRRPDAHRSLHPTHSVAAIGADAGEFVGGHLQSTPCARDSPYGRLVAARGGVLFVGIDLSSWTLVHGFEEWAPVPWVFDRWEQLFTVCDGGAVISVPSRRHTADPACKRDYPSLEPLLRRHALIRYGTLGRARLRWVDASGAEALLVPLMRERPDLVLAGRAAPVG